MINLHKELILSHKKESRVLIQAPTQLKPEASVLSIESHTQKANYDPTYKKNTQNRQINNAKDVDYWLLGNHN